MNGSTGLPLEGVRVVDLADQVGEAAARLLADLGADTVKVEPPEGSPTRLSWPSHEGRSLGFALRNANKRSARLDLTDPTALAEAQALIAAADIAFLTPEAADAVALDSLSTRAPHLVSVISSPFGRTGPRSAWQATERTLYALSGALSRSGRPGAEPLLPPAGLADATAATYAAWTALVAYLRRQQTGAGQVVDLSHHEAVVVGLDPAFGVQGSAAAGRSGKIRRDRPSADSYPIYPCADGHVRLCLLAKRQWRGMFGWLGEPEEFADPSYDSIAARFAAADRLDPLITALFARHTGAELVDEAARRGVPLAQVLSLGEALASDHFVASGTVAKAEIASGLVTTVPVGCIDVDGERLGIRTPAPDLVEATTVSWTRDRDAPAEVTGDPAGLPFDGLRVLDLGVIVFGAEVGRAFADLGADVIKLESLAFPDGLRQTRGGESMNASFAWGQRNKRSMGLDIRTEEGHAIFLELARRSDVVLSNFKPGTLASLGIGPDVLAEANPRIVVLESAAFSSRGPWARRLGYGPLVRAACGISSLWRYDADDVACWDGVTVFPDHVAARVAATAVAAALVARERTGRGCRLEVGQSDVVLHQLGALAALESLEPGSAAATGNRGRELFGGLFPAAGDDEWCLVEARTPQELAVLQEVVGLPGGSDVAATHAAVARWTRDRAPQDVMVELQSLGLPCAAMLRLPELLEDPQLRARGTYTSMHHPALDYALPAESPLAPYGSMPDRALAPAPAVGQHTREICTGLLGISSAEYDVLVRRGVLHDRSAAAARLD